MRLDRRTTSSTYSIECFRIQREAIEAAGHYIPLIVENVRGAQKWVGRARWNYGSFYLWGDVPALMPMTSTRKMGWDNTVTGRLRREDDALKVGNASARTFAERRAFAQANPELDPNNFWHGSLEGRKVSMNFHEHEKTGKPGRSFQSAAENGKGDRWFQDGAATHGSKSPKRKMASAMIAKIPYPLAEHIAKCFKPIPVDSTSR